jgi:hypothetical protein
MQVATEDERDHSDLVQPAFQQEVRTASIGASAERRHLIVVPVASRAARPLNRCRGRSRHARLRSFRRLCPAPPSTVARIVASGAGAWRVGMFAWLSVRMDNDRCAQVGQLKAILGDEHLGRSISVDEERRQVLVLTGGVQVATSRDGLGRNPTQIDASRQGRPLSRPSLCALTPQ